MINTYDKVQSSFNSSIPVTEMSYIESTEIGEIHTFVYHKFYI